jgi:hypothetical protein
MEIGDEESGEEDYLYQKTTVVSNNSLSNLTSPASANRPSMAISSIVQLTERLVRPDH